MKTRLNDTRIWVPVVFAAALAAGIALGKLINSETGMSAGQKKLSTVLNMVRSDYVDPVNTDSLIEAVMPGLMMELDPHSSYIPAADLRAFNEEIDGSFSGIGVSFTMNNDTVNVIEVIGGGPAERAGIVPGDRIVTVDGEEVSGQGYSSERIRMKLKGETGTHVALGVKRVSSPRTLQFDVERGDVPVISIDSYYMIDPQVGYIHVNQFSRNTYNEFLNALAQLQHQGAEGYIVDLRGNVGGYLEMAVLMANEFLRGGSPIVYMRTRNGVDDRAFISDGNGSFPRAKLVVLLDEYSASSSEIFAGAIQDNDRGLVVGRRSFGKGLVQRQAILPDSSALQLTIGRYYTPSGRCVQKDYSNKNNYRNDIIERYNHGEAFSADSIHQDTTNVFRTLHGRAVFGGGGIMPDVFVPSDTSEITGYYMNVSNAGLLQKFTFDYADTHRDELSKAANTAEFLQLLPPDEVLLRQFVNFAASNGIAPRWYYINISQNLLLDQLKAMIARDILGYSSSFEIINTRDTTVKEALRRINGGDADYPVKVQGKRN